MTTARGVWRWVLVLFLGMLSIGAGIVVIAKPAHSLPTLAVITGIFVLVDGLVRIALAVGGPVEERGLVAVLGVLDVVVGTLLVRHPARGVEFVALLIGIWLIAAGLLRVLAAAFVEGPLVWRVVTGLALAIAGIVIVADPDIGYATLALITGIGLIAYGLAAVIAELDRQYLHSASTPPA